MRLKHSFLAILMASTAFIACQSNNSTESSNDTTAVDTSITPGTTQYCYEYVKNNDTVKMTLMSSGPITTGELSYNLFEKDKNNGIFEGELHGDTLIAEYTFNSEGKESIRQVAFLKKGDQLVEGYGDVKAAENGKMMFKNTSTLQFGGGIVLNKVECR